MRTELFITQIAISNCKDQQNLCFGEGTTYVRLQDEAGGYFAEIVQEPNAWNGNIQQVIRLDFEEIDVLHKALNRLKGEAEDWYRIGQENQQ